MRNFQNFRYTSQGCSLFWKFRKCCSIRNWELPEMCTRICGRIESGPNSRFIRFSSRKLELLVEWFAFRKFNNFPVSWKLSKEISVPFVPVSKVPEFWLNGRRHTFVLSAIPYMVYNIPPVFLSPDWTPHLQ